MTERFLKFMPFIFEWEGGYDNDPDDPGGETKYGIDKRSHPKENIRALTKERAQEIYWAAYWQKYGCGDLPEKLGEAVMNCCVNCGGGRARQFMKSSSGDARKFVNEQEAFYHRIVANRPKSRKYLKGWLNRTRALRVQLGLK